MNDPVDREPEDESQGEDGEGPENNWIAGLNLGATDKVIAGLVLGIALLAMIMAAWDFSGL
jgi:hypothetical protein